MMDEQTKIAEAQVIGYVISDEKLYYQYAPRLLPSLFTNYKSIWDAITASINAGRSLDVITISRELKDKGSFTAITQMVRGVDFTTEFESWLEHLEHNHKRELCRKAIVELSELVNKDEIEGVEKVLHNTIMNLTREDKDYKSMREHIRDVFGHIDNIKSGNRVTGFATGFEDFDKFSGGLQPSDLTIIAATTSQGKTTLALSMAYHIGSIESINVGIFSLEMSTLQITARLLAKETDVPSKNILAGNTSYDELHNNLKYLTNNKIHIDPSRDPKISSIVAKMRYMVSRFNCRVFFIDYLQMITNYVKGQTTEQNVADICRTLKSFAKENDVSIVLLCQLNRGDGGNPSPKMSRLRGSGQIEEAADNVILLYRPDYYNINTFEDGTDALGLAEMILDKGRNIGTARFRIEFHPEIPTFTNIKLKPYGTQSAAEIGSYSID